MEVQLKKNGWMDGEHVYPIAQSRSLHHPVSHSLPLRDTGDQISSLSMMKNPRLPSNDWTIIIIMSPFPTFLRLSANDTGFFADCQQQRKQASKQASKSRPPTFPIIRTERPGVEKHDLTYIYISDCCAVLCRHLSSLP